ncbi:endonuclease/exonuclease/phosphatase family protein [Sanguibacter antarcticus]|uniref:Endonuclease/exonuclease/phosphatase family metal-dependent hydrolase n=1 Tax=Sanguibacter antarcticus TaxID=372484 RepID=A0A2A9E654_9MICO|nr:endonuclease/exonuclease/phosphatase family protein [Sanguibacter antarcticus]PFG33712.1 endonuclease/exonuclease/phosphatase family metal-dependent hydrolase [Sanguibacter antarcticus]
MVAHPALEDRPVTPGAVGASVALLAVLTATCLELVRTSGPLIDLAFSSGLATAAITALGTFVAAGVFVLVLAARRPLDGRVLLLGVTALAVGRLASQALDGPLRYGITLATVALSLAVVLVAASVVGRVSGTAVAVAVAGGALGSAALNLLLATWDAVWRTGPVGWAVPVVLALTSLVLAWRLRALPAAPAVRGLWVLGPFLSLAVSTFANPAFIASQSGAHLAFAGLTIVITTVGVTTLMTRSLVDVSAIPGRFDGALVAVLVLAPVGLFFARDWPGAASPAVSVLVLVCVVLLGTSATVALAQALTRPVHRQTALRLGGSASCAGLGVILPLLVYQLDYEVPLGVPNALVPVLVALILAVMGLRARRLARALQDEISVVAQPLTHGTVRPVAALVGLLAVVGTVVAAVPSSAAEAADEDPTSVRLLDWNVHYGVNAEPGVDLDAIVQVIDASGADLVTLQEVSRGWIMGGGADMAAYLADQLGMDYVYSPAADQQFGNAILWKPHLGDVSDVEQTGLPFGMGPQKRSAVSATFDIDGTALRVTSVHLQHRVQNTPTRIDQLETLLAAEPVEGAYVLAGDLNAEPGWAETRLLERSGLVSAQDEAGQPTALTFPSTSPDSRIDWVYGSDVSFSDVEVIATSVSDHRPIVATISVAP